MLLFNLTSEKMMRQDGWVTCPGLTAEEGEAWACSESLFLTVLLIDSSQATEKKIRA